MNGANSFPLPPVLQRGSDDPYDEMRASAYEIAMGSPEVKSLLGVARDTKTRKSLDRAGVLTGVLYLAPGSVSGHEMCRARTKGCSRDCLFTAGHGTYTNIKIGRLRKTYQFVYRQEEFLACLNKEVGKLAVRAERQGVIPAVRLNGTSDIPWELYPLGEYDHIFQAHPDMQFYDYTKLYPRLSSCREIPNYHLTYSYAETKQNRINSGKALESGYNVAAVFGTIPGEFLGHRVIDGDYTDVRFWDGGDEPVVIGLRAKGKARSDYDTGFVIRDIDTASVAS